MWINPDTLAVARSVDELKSMNPNWGAPYSPTADMIAAIGFVPVAPSLPTYDAATQSAEEIAPSLINGVWTQQWHVIDLTDTQKQEALAGLVNKYVVAIQSMLDTKAQERRYYDILSACTYATDPNSTFQAEAQACVAWRGAVWATAYQVLDEVTASTRAQPTIAEMLALLPTMEWPA